MNNDGRIDALIDEIARDMTNAPVNGGFARRVGARLGEGDAQLVRADRPRLRLLAPAVAACVLLLAVFIARERRERTAPARTDTAQLRGNAKESASPDAAPAHLATVAVSAPTPLDTGARRRPWRQTDVAPSAPDADLAPLALPPIDIERIDVSPIAHADQIDIRPIAIERIEISAMP